MRVEKKQKQKQSITARTEERSLQESNEASCDGLHKIETSVALLNLHDTIHIEQLTHGGIRLQVRNRLATDSNIAKFNTNAMRGEKNIAMLAARALERAIADDENARSIYSNLHLRIVIHKAIPVGAGLGGGSSDAATFLLYAKKQLEQRGLKFSKKFWLEVAKSVGSDIPMFMLEGFKNHLFVSGKGEKVVARKPLPPCGVVLLYGESLSTRKVYHHYDQDNNVATNISQKTQRNSDSDKNQLETSIDEKNIEQALKHTQNDLQQVACKIDHNIAKRLQALAACSEVFCARLTGSGSACFGLTKLGMEGKAITKLQNIPHTNAIATQFLDA